MATILVKRTAPRARLGIEVLTHTTIIDPHGRDGDSKSFALTSSEGDEDHRPLETTSKRVRDGPHPLWIGKRIVER